ncbi:MAG: WecB/TagA/CpsF family glycosyltransferase [Solirubrobacterales bacterium]
MSAVDQPTARPEVPEAGGESKDDAQPPRPGRVWLPTFDCPLDLLDMDSTVERCLELAENGGGRQVSINAAKVTMIAEDRRLSDFVNGSDVISADGQSIVWAARLLGYSVPERVAGTDVMLELIAAAAGRELSVFLLGARQDVLDDALDVLRERHPTLQISGRNGYFTAAEEAGVAAEVRAASPDLLFVGMPSPQKELLLDQHLADMGSPFAMGVGGSIDVIAGRRTRAPEIVQRIGLEWLFRLAQEPRRMWRRYLMGNLRFGRLLGRALAERARSSLRGSR